MPLVPDNPRVSGFESSKPILILGLGVSGEAAAELALRKGWAVQVIDDRGAAAQRHRARGLRERGATVYLDWSGGEERLPAPSLIVTSPGIAPQSRLGRLARSFACPLLSELEWGYRHCHCPILAVTGTNGKTTTVEMIAHILNQAGGRAPTAGNIGSPLSQVASRSANADCLVVEVSSYQLEDVSQFAPLASALLNLSPDHLDRYASMDAYVRAKARLLECSRLSRKVVLRKDLLSHPLLAPSLRPLRETLSSFSSRDPAASLFLDPENVIRHSPDGGRSGVALISLDELQAQGRHNAENAMAAMALCAAAGLPLDQAAHHLKTYVPSPHRLEIVCTRSGIRVINDSKSTNPDSMARALEAVRDSGGRRILLIAGGLDKNLDFSALSPLVKSAVRQVFLIGRAQQRLASLWGGTVACSCCQSMETAVDAALDSAASGDIVLLSPGCASQDMFANYAERGTVFSDLVRRRLPE